MAKYQFVVEATITMGTDVEADTLEQAIEIAKGRCTMSLCYECAHGEEGCWNTSGELDADPENSKLVAASVDGKPVGIRRAKLAWNKDRL